MASPAAAHFDALVDARFAQFGQAASLTLSHVAGAPLLAVSAILVEGEAGNSLADLAAPLRQAGTQVHIRAAEIAAQSPGNTPQKGDTIAIAGRTFTVIEAPIRRDARRLVWTLTVKE